MKRTVLLKYPKKLFVLYDRPVEIKEIIKTVRHIAFDFGNDG